MSIRIVPQNASRYNRAVGGLSEAGPTASRPARRPQLRRPQPRQTIATKPAASISDEGSGTCASVKLSSDGLPVAFGAGNSAVAWYVRLVSDWSETNPRKVNVGLDGMLWNTN